MIIIKNYKLKCCSNSIYILLKSVCVSVCMYFIYIYIYIYQICLKENFAFFSHKYIYIYIYIYICVCVSIHLTSLPLVACDTRSDFKWSKAALNLVFLLHLLPNQCQRTQFSLLFTHSWRKRML